MSFVVGLIIGWFLGVIMACIVLAKKNLAKMQEVEKKLAETKDNSIGLAKAAYKYYSKSPEERAAEEAKETKGEN